jgi:hypothetical protein
MKLAAPRSLVCEQVETLLGRFRPPWLDLFESALRFPAHRSRPFSEPGSSSLELSSPSAYPFNRLLSVPFRAPAFRPWTRLASERLPWGFVPLRVLNQPQHRHGFPFLMPGSFPGLPRLRPALSGLPSSAFLAPSTSCSATDLASLFHPAAAFRVHPSGICSSMRIHSGLLRLFPSWC